MPCPDCGTINPAGARFCGECGRGLALACRSCGASTDPQQRFCRECGTELSDPPPTTQRRTVSVMFADLVGSTPMADARDAEEVRDILTRYFDTCRMVIGRYGGTVEKFIGDAVMAVWGAPRAHQDDPERAVRAALDIVTEVGALGGEVGVQGLAARAGVATGEVAVTVGAVGQGIVTGDTVNTASRVQAAALPGGVRVDERTRLASSRAIAYRDCGLHQLKGKARPEQLFDALRVVAAVGGVQRVDGPEAPFVGRERELRLVKELFHATEESGHARLVSVTGPAGIGKSRLGWEFLKYLDGLAARVLWHAGRCPPYGEGVAHSPLAEMVRMRFGMTESDTATELSDKLRAGLLEYVAVAEDREWLAPRLGALLGLEDARDRSRPPREELFGAWRLLFEHLARAAPVVMLLEELQWADAGLMDFVEDLLDLSRGFPIYVLTLAGPELGDRRSGWGAGRGNATCLVLDALPDDAVRELLDGLVDGLPPAARDAVVEQAEGVPLYAVETIRMLAARDLLVPRDGSYVVADDAGDRLTRAGLMDLGLPPSLTGLVLARLDDLPPPERALVADAAVLGTSFPRDTLGRLVDLSPAELDELLRSLLRKEILTVTVDPRSPERGQYRFLQQLVRSVAYGTLSRHDRKLKHLAVAERLEADVTDPAEIADVLADHYDAAYQAGPTDPDAPDVRALARAAYLRAGDRAFGLALPENALAAYRRATDLAVDDGQRAEGLARAGRAAVYAGSPVAVDLLGEAVELHQAAGLMDAAVEPTLLLARALNIAGRAPEAAVILQRALEVHDRGTPDRQAAQLAAQLALTLRFARRPHEMSRPLDVALTYGQALGLPEVLALALTARADLMMESSRFTEAEFDYSAAITVAERHDLTHSVARGNAGLANLRIQTDMADARGPAERAVTLMRRVGLRLLEMVAVSNLVLLEIMTGRWERAELLANEALALETAQDQELMHEHLALVHVLHGELERASAHAEECRTVFDSDDPEARAMAKAAVASVALGGGDFETALAMALATIEDTRGRGLASAGLRQAWPDALEAALAVDDLPRVDELLALVADAPPGTVPPYLHAQHLRNRGLLAQRRAEPSAAESDLGAALDEFRRLEYPFWVARTLLDLGTLLGEAGRDAEALPLREEAEATFTSLGARPWLDQVHELTSG